jgi:hypothetical protein
MAASPTPGGLGSRLREARERRGLTVRQALQEFIAQYPPPTQAGGRRAGSLAFEDNEAIESDRRIAAALLRILIASAFVLGLMLYFGSC